MGHHPNCKLSDKVLVLLCEQCGETESAEVIWTMLETVTHNIRSLCAAYPERYRKEDWSSTLRLAEEALIAIRGKGKG